MHEEGATVEDLFLSHTKLCSRQQVVAWLALRKHPHLPTLLKRFCTRGCSCWCTHVFYHQVSIHPVSVLFGESQPKRLDCPARIFLQHAGSQPCVVGIVFSSDGEHPECRLPLALICVRETSTALCRVDRTRTAQNHFSARCNVSATCFVGSAWIGVPSGPVFLVASRAPKRGTRSGISIDADAAANRNKVGSYQRRFARQGAIIQEEGFLGLDVECAKNKGIFSSLPF